MPSKRACVMLLVAMIVGCAATANAGRFFNRRNDAPQERVTVLPEDGGANWVTIMTHTDWQKRPEEAAQVRTWQREAQPMAGPDAHWLYYTADEAMYRERLKAANPHLPAIMIQEPSGKLLFKDYADVDRRPVQVAQAPGETGITVQCFHHKRPCPCPTPNPDVDVNVSVPPVPDKVPTPAAEPKATAPETSPALLWAIIAVVVVLTIVGTATVGFVKRVKKVTRGR